MGFFITFEGTEGSGKSTQIAKLRDYLAGEGLDVIAVREPGSTKVGEKVRDILLSVSEGAGMETLTELFLYEAARVEIVTKLIVPALQAGKIVLCDRYTDSTFAYQCFGRHIPYDKVETVNALATDGLKPDLTILIDCPIDVGLARANSRNEAAAPGADRFEREARMFHERVRNGYHWLARLERRIKVFDGNRSVEAVHADIRMAAQDALRMAKVI
ncbi:MAG: dTMP kinase [Deltaproteobacteria bacterium]|nr:dTMP kinase [Deltaproteobacteria bacterium]